MVELKKEAVKDVTSLTKAAPVALAKTKEVLNQAVADLYVAHVALHQVHWYMRGRGFLVWHPKMDEYMDALDGHLDEISERLITLGGKPYSTLTEFLQNSEIEEEEEGEFRNVEESLERVLDVYRYLITLFQKALDVTDEEGDDVTNDIFVGAKAELEKTVWMLAAELGQAPGL
ncbi:DPS family peroxide resistance protein [Streptococcus pneumoniae]|uniref:Dps family protein n=1 Tax=Streptococcus pneumoniae TaxID=1313 RepID=UPI0007689BAF|nr:Dps family protein [Streptococcus pneumoniae]CZE36176.1 DPS family peroxide resistance protein [Streptococcus pneumoniae]